MEELVRDQQQEVLVRALLHEGEARHDHGAAPPVLEAAPALVVEMQDEQVAVGIRQPAEDGRLGIDDLRQVGKHAAGVEIAPSPDHQLVLHALGGEGVRAVRAVGAALEGTVGQLVVVLRLPGAVLEREGHPDPPFRRQLHAQRAGFVLAADDEHGRGAGVQERVGSVDVIGADRQLETVQPVGDRTARAPWGRTRQVCLSTFSTGRSRPSPCARSPST